jgi:predicted RNase H-like HicB family nuclease
VNAPNYHIDIFWSDEDQLWLADVPDLSGCTTHGRTPEEAAANAVEAIELWVDSARDHGEPLPEPRYRSTRAARLLGLAAE